MTRYAIIRTAVLLRPMGQRCERCGEKPAVHAHHRWLKGQGGPDIATNLAALCDACHRWAHGHPAEARKGGWILVPGTDPEFVPIMLWSGELAWLNEMAGYESLSEAERSYVRPRPGK